MKQKQSLAGSPSPTQWAISDLGIFYSTYRTDFVVRATRRLRDSSRAEEIVQDALIKVMLAAPELESVEHALAYMHRTIDNLCIDVFRLEGRRPNLVALDESSNEIEEALFTPRDHSDVLIAAEDAVIVRQALSLLSSAERAALILWEVENRSTEEISRELGIKESAVRHTVSRARASLRRVLSELVLDESRGLTALDMLSTTYKKAAVLAKKTSKMALSLILVLFAFLGFNSVPINVGTSGPTVEDSTTATDLSVISSPMIKEDVSVLGSSEPTRSAKLRGASEENLKSTELSFPGLDRLGVPTGFTVADSSGAIGNAYFTERTLISTETELIAGQIIKTDSGAANVFISQTLTTNESGLLYRPIVSFGQAGVWIPLFTTVSSTEIKRQSDGNYLFTAYIAVDSAIVSPIKIASTAFGRDLTIAPKQVITRLVLNPSKTQVLAQAILVVERGVKV